MHSEHGSLKALEVKLYLGFCDLSYDHSKIDL